MTALRNETTGSLSLPAPERRRRSALHAPLGRGLLGGLLAALVACSGGNAAGPSQSSPAATSAPVAKAPPAAQTSSAAAAGTAAPVVSADLRAPEGWPHPMNALAPASKDGMVASDGELASEVGADILKRGGNAVDAAVATAFALAVVFPQAGNVGGGGFMLVRLPDGKSDALDFRETAPRKATRTMFEGKGGRGGASLIGHLASGVPGSVAGLWEAHKKYGSLPWADLCAPAIRFAEEGFRVDEELASSVRRMAEALGRFPASAALYLPGGKPLEVGATLRNPDLAKVLRRISERGPVGFYEGETANLLVAEMKRGGGLITHEDLKAYKPRWRTPVEVTYRGHRVLSMPPPSSGGLVLALVLNVLQGYDLPKMPWHSADALHLEAEALRRGFALRNHYLGDPDFVKVPLDVFLSAESAEKLRASISKDKATPSAEVTPGQGSGNGGGKHTTHFSVVDGKGGAVALTTTINTSYGSAVTVAGAGFFMNNEMDDFTTEPGKPNVFGLIQGDTNAILPGKRMLSSMTPTIVIGPDGKVLLVTGAAGGPTIITSVFHIVSNVVDYGMDISAAVAAPRMHHQHLPDRITYEEKGLPAEVIQALKARGHELVARGHLGDAPSILRRGDQWMGMAEPRNGVGAARGPSAK